VLQVRDKEADIDSMIAPIEDMYSLLLRYEVGVGTSSRIQCHPATFAQLHNTTVPVFAPMLFAADLCALAFDSEPNRLLCQHAMRVIIMLS
jgi:hypothetical protein